MATAFAFGGFAPRTLSSPVRATRGVPISTADGRVSARRRCVVYARSSPTPPTTTEKGARPASAGSRPDGSAETPAGGGDSYVRLAMRNMVHQGGKAILHFALTFTVIVTFFIGLAYLFK